MGTPQSPHHIKQPSHHPRVWLHQLSRQFAKVLLFILPSLFVLAASAQQRDASAQQRDASAQQREPASGLTKVSVKPLISADELNKQLEQPLLRIIDIRSPQAYFTAHIPGALNAPYGTWRGPASNPGELPSIEKLTALVQSLGLTAAHHIVVTSHGDDPTDFGSAARVYWTLKVLGLERLSRLALLQTLSGSNHFSDAGYKILLESEGKYRTSTWLREDKYVVNMYFSSQK